MKIINKNLIANSNSKTQIDIFNEIADMLLKEKFIKNKKELVDGFKKREKQGSTGMEKGFAIPHSISIELKEPKIVVLKNVNVSKWETLDKKPIDTVIAIIVPKDGREDHLTILSKVSGKLANDTFSEMIKNSSSAKIEKEINGIINEKDLKIKNNKKNINYDIVAVTSCPTGIAHTYMAAEKLESAAKELNLSIKIETQGQTTQNVLSQEEIDNSKGIILAIDRGVEMERFSGRDIHKTGTKKVIANAKLHINETLENKNIETVVVSSTGNSLKGVVGEGELTLHNFGKRSWKAVMNGVSFMLPFVIFGGIFIALSFLIDINNAGSSTFGSTTKVAGFFNSIGGISMGLMIPILVAYTMQGMIGRPGLLPGFIIGMLAAGNGPIFTEVFNIGIPGWVPDEFSDATAVSSGFIGGVAGAFLATVIIVYVSKTLDFLPQSLRGIKQILLLPLFGTALASITFWFVNIPLIYISWGLLFVLDLINKAGLQWLLAMLLAGMMAIDMGGPINKTAYVFGTVMMSISSDGQIYMAAVMAGGMVPPLSIAIATLFNRKQLWDSQDIDAGYTNWVMGASFITEGAIPFASKYPKSIMPGIILGSLVTGLLVGLLQIQLQAPHGGIFVFALLSSGISSIPIWGSIILYSISISIGSIFGAMIITLLRKHEIKKKI